MKFIANENLSKIIERNKAFKECINRLDELSNLDNNKINKMANLFKTNEKSPLWISDFSQIGKLKLEVEYFTYDSLNERGYEILLKSTIKIIARAFEIHDDLKIIASGKNEIARYGYRVYFSQDELKTNDNLLLATNYHICNASWNSLIEKND